MLDSDWLKVQLRTKLAAWGDVNLVRFLCQNASNIGDFDQFNWSKTTTYRLISLSEMIFTCAN